MRIYLAYWNNGLEYEDSRIILIGVFTTRKLANNACKELYNNIKLDENKSYWYRDQSTFIKSAKLDQIIK